MGKIVLTQAEIIVLSKVLLGVPLPPLGMPVDPDLAERSWEEVVSETLEGLVQKGWVHMDDDGSPIVRSDLATLLRAAGYLVVWVIVTLHEKDNPVRQIGFYHDGNHVVQHELDVVHYSHALSTGPDDMGKTWMWQQIETWASRNTTLPQQGVSFSIERWEQVVAERLKNSKEIPPTFLEDGDLRQFQKDILQANALVQVNCLCDVYTGNQEKFFLLLGPERNWLITTLLLEVENEEGKIYAWPMTLVKLQQTINNAWQAIKLLQSEK